jgi:Cu2+-exporting ATPase
MPETALRLVGQDDAVETVSVCGWQGGSGAGARGGGLSCRRPVGGGSTQADESLLTGESRPVDKRAGDEVVAGSMNLSAPVTMQVERVGRTPGTRPSWP